MARTYRIVAAVLIAAISGLFCYMYQQHWGYHGGDLGWILHSVPPLLAGDNPYHVTAETWPLRYPLVTLLAVLPLAWLPPNMAAGVFFGVSSGALVYGLARSHGWRLLVLLSFPYIGALQVAQWSPLLSIAYMYTPLVPLAMLKPSIGLPIVFATRITRRDMLIVGAALGVSFVLVPTWPRDMFAQWGTHPNVTPILTPSGWLLLVLAVLRWRVFRRSRGARFALLLACVPQTLFYDTLLLALVPSSRRWLVAWICCTWIGYAGWYYAPWLGVSSASTSWLVGCLYFPALASALWCGEAIRSASPVIVQPTTS